MHRMRDRLISKTETEAACDEIADQSSKEDRRKAGYEREVPDKEDIPDTSRHAEPGTFCRYADEKTCKERSCHRCMHRTRP